MCKKTQKKEDQLGESLGKAQHKLRKSVMFHLLKQLGQNYCFQCGAEIESEEELSIEHKIPWLDSEDPKKLFYDLDNIGFSHLSCNSRASRKREAACGSRKKYEKGCRCDKCVEEYRKYSREWMKKKRKIVW